jgi:Spy/CpxP family protein refolding chaperone
MNRKNVLALAALIFGATVVLMQPSLAATTTGSQQTCSQGSGHGKRIAQYLGLSAQQQAQIKSIIATYKPQIKAIHDDSSLTLQQKHAKLKPIFKAMEAQIMPILTPAQQKKAEALKAKFRHSGGRHAWLSKLNLTASQQAQVKQIFAGQKSQIEAVRANTSLTADQRHTQIKAIHQAAMQQIKGILTPAQLQQLDAMRASHK